MVVVLYEVLVLVAYLDPVWSGLVCLAQRGHLSAPPYPPPHAYGLGPEREFEFVEHRQLLSSLKYCVGLTGFEPAASAPRKRRATKLRYNPLIRQRHHSRNGTLAPYEP